MNAIAQVNQWPGHVALARGMGFRVGELEDQFDAMLLVCGITLTAWLSFFHPTTTGDLWLVGMLAALAAKWSAQVTAGTIEALRLLRLAPSPAPTGWLRGWAQHQLGHALALGGVGTAVLAVHQAGMAWLALGGVVLAQALAAWAAMALRRRAGVAWPLLLLLTAGLAWQTQGWRWLTLPHVRHIWASTGLALLAVGAGLLLGARARLQRLREPGHAGQGWAIEWIATPGRAMLAWLTPTTLTGARWWQGSRAMFICSVLFIPWGEESRWGADVSLSKLLFTALWVLILLYTLRSRPVHWRRALAPGGQLRQRLGQHMLANALRVQASALVFLLTLGVAWGWVVGNPPLIYLREAVQDWPAAVELVFWSALAVVLAGHTRHVPRRWLTRALILLIACGLAWVLYTGYRQRPDIVWGHVDGLYLGLLALGTALLFPLCNRAWAQVDLHELMRASIDRTAGAWP